MGAKTAPILTPLLTPWERYLALKSIITRLLSKPANMRRHVTNLMPKEWVRQINHCWALHARPDQKTPAGDWLIWLLLGGRGSGKTRAGAEWVRERVKNGARRIALVAPTYNDAREVMLEGESGLLNIGPPEERPAYVSSRRRLEWPGGAVGQIFSGEDPDGLRGPQFDSAWADEFCAWAYPDEALANLRLGLRLGSDAGPPQLTVTTTPRPTASLRALMQATALKVSRARTSDNAENLSPAFLSAMEDTYGGTHLGRQELGGEIMSDFPGALWTRAMISRAQQGEQSESGGPYDEVVLAVDPPVSTGPKADACGLIVAARLPERPGEPGRAVVLHDGTVQGRSPEGWAAKAAQLYRSYNVSYVAAEANQGGEMVRTVLRQADPRMIVQLVHASASKTARAVPAAMLYEQGRIYHQGAFEALEDELCQMGAQGITADSPNRADALVWALTQLLIKRTQRPRIWVAGQPRPP